MSLLLKAEATCVYGTASTNQTGAHDCLTLLMPFNKCLMLHVVGSFLPAEELSN